MQPSIINLENITNSIFSSHFSDVQLLNSTILEKFILYKDHPGTRKSHLFENRYENTYIAPNIIKETETVLLNCNQCVQKITGEKSDRSGIWFNYMEPGNLTLPHTHDDADELYSAVYYVSVPDKSGTLIITENNKEIIIKPKEGMLVLFPPSLLHHVTKNESNDNRLSLGINIGN